MKRKCTLFLMLIAGMGTVFAEMVQIDGLYYELNTTDQTAEVRNEFTLDPTEPNYAGLTSLNIPSSVTYEEVDYTVTSIGELAFSDCPDLISVTIPKSVTIIDELAFFHSKELTTVTMAKGVTEIRNGAFEACSALVSVTIPNSVTYIDNYAFYECSALVNVTIPNSVTFLGDGAFGRCTDLSYVTFPNSLNMSEVLFFGIVLV